MGMLEWKPPHPSSPSQVNVCRSNPFALPSDKPFLGEILEAKTCKRQIVFSRYDMTVSYYILNRNPYRAAHISIFTGWVLYMYNLVKL